MDDAGSLQLTRIRVYPLKGAAGFDVVESGVDEFGLPGDRRWMLATPDGSFISQRSHSRLCLIQSSLDEGARGIEDKSFLLRAPGMAPFRLTVQPSDTWMEVRLHKDRFPALVGFGEADVWFSEFLGEACRLVFIPDEVCRPVDPEWAPGHRVSLADGYPLHLTTEESLLEMNGKLSRETDMLRYRPNLVVKGGRPWDEDRWRVLETGDITLSLVKPCARCAVITVDQSTGQKGLEPLRSLGGFREWEGKVFFGQNAVFEGAGRFRVGSDVRILETGAFRPPLSPDSPGG